MQRIILLLVLSVIFMPGLGQRKKHDPVYALIVSPNEIFYDKSFEKEIQDFTIKLKKGVSESQSELKKNLDDARAKNKPGFYLEGIQNEINYYENADFFKLAGMLSQSFLWLVRWTSDSTNIIRFKDIKLDRTKESLQLIAEEEKKEYILNFPRISITKKGKDIYTTVDIQFYNSTTKQFLIDSFFTSEEDESLNNLNLEGLPMQGETKLQQSFFNALSKGISAIICSLNCGWIAEENNLENRRAQILTDNYYRKTFDKELLRNFLPADDSTIDINIAYQALYSPDSTKFIAFFLEQVTDSADLSRSRHDENDTTLITHSYVIAGIKHENKWYYDGRYYGNLHAAIFPTIEDRKKDHFNMLQKWDYGFFTEGSIEPNPDFWVTKLFRIIPDKIQFTDEEFSSARVEKYNFLPYHGQYQIVAKELRKKKRLVEEAMDDELIQKYILPKIKSDMDTSDSYNLLYPIDRSVFLYNYKSKTGYIKFFVLVNHGSEKFTYYEWKYLRPQKWKGRYWSSDLEKLLDNITYWRAGMDYLQDDNFWNNFVLIKDSDAFKYLVPVR